MLVEYHSNNSGGEFWLKDEDWTALEKAGWQVDWYEKRFLGTLATRAQKEFNTIEEAIEEFENITGQYVFEIGCECCGPPHEFYWTDKEGTHYGAGEELYDKLEWKY